MSAAFPGHHRPISMAPVPQAMPQQSSRLSELLEAIRHEFENASHDSSAFKAQRDEYEHKINTQIQEVAQMQQSVYELERAYHKMRQQYEEEILRLRRELESRGIALPPSAVQLSSGARA